MRPFAHGALAGLAVLGLGCDVKSAEAAREGSDGAAKPSPETRRKATVTPELIEASEKLLRQHAEAPLGSEFPLRVAGKRLVARIEEHDNASGSPGRPAGKHKGITVYEP